MANITKTFIYPLPTTWKGQDQDDANVGVATYIGPDKLTCWFEKDANGDKTKKFVLITFSELKSNLENVLPFFRRGIYLW